MAVALLAVTACGGEAPQSPEPACDWCPGSPEVTTTNYGGTTCACPAPGGIGFSVQFFSDYRAPSCAHVQCMFAYYCAPPTGHAPECPQ